MKTIFGGIAAGLLMLAFVALGQWQLERASFKDALLADFAVAQQAPAISLDDALRAAAPSGVTRVIGSGRFLLPRLLQDNAQVDGQTGVRWWQPLRTSGGALVLADLGFVSYASDRSLPTLPAAMDTQPREFSGLLRPWPGQGIALEAEPEALGAGDLRLNRLDRASVQAALAQAGRRSDAAALAEQVLLINPDEPIGASRQLDPLPNTLPPARHRGYALTWFALATTTAVTALVLWTRERRSRHAAATGARP